MAGIKLDFGFERTADEPIDASQTLSKAEMLAMSDNAMPDVYFAVCKDDKKFYLYDKSATPNSETGKFFIFESGKTYTEGDGIKITGTEISADTTVLAEKSELPDMTEYYTKSEIDGKLTGAFHYKGSVATVAELPASGNEVGDVYNVTENGDNYAWDGTAWDKLSGTVDLSNYYNKSETDGLLDDKVDKVAGKGLSTNDYTDADKVIVDGVTTALDSKQDTLTQGDGITIDATTDTISADFATDAEITAIVTSVFGA